MKIPGIPFEVCDICRWEAALIESPGVGDVCDDCATHVADGLMALARTPGTASHMIPDGDRNNGPRPSTSEPSATNL